MTNKVWNLMYVLGNTTRIIGSADNPQARKTALAGAAIVNANGWRVWVEHCETGKRLYENPSEKAHRETIESPARQKGNERGLAE